MENYECYVKCFKKYSVFPSAMKPDIQSWFLRIAHNLAIVSPAVVEEGVQ